MGKIRMNYRWAPQLDREVQRPLQGGGYRSSR